MSQREKENVMINSTVKNEVGDCTIYSVVAQDEGLPTVIQNARKSLHQDAECSRIVSAATDAEFFDQVFVANHQNAEFCGTVPVAIHQVCSKADSAATHQDTELCGTVRAFINQDAVYSKADSAAIHQDSEFCGTVPAFINQDAVYSKADSAAIHTDTEFCGTVPAFINQDAVYSKADSAAIHPDAEYSTTDSTAAHDAPDAHVFVEPETRTRAQDNWLRLVLLPFWLRLREVTFTQIFFRRRQIQGIASVPPDGEFYKMNHKRRGVAVIFNHENFDDSMNLDKRLGAKKDRQRLEKTFRDLRFDVRVYTDFTYRQISTTLEDLASEDHTDADCLVVVVNTHGDAGGDHGELCAKDKKYPASEIWCNFTGEKCIKLAGKPKMFFIQACRGKAMAEGICLRNGDEIDTVPVGYSYTIPALADILTMFSTPPGYVAWHNSTDGSWFIEALCNELELHKSRKDLLTILTFTCRKVAVWYASSTNKEETSNMKQIPMITSTLTRLVHFGHHT